MDSNAPREKLESRAGLETSSIPASPHKPEASREVTKRAKEVLKTEGPEAKEGAEGVELSEGKVSEVAGEDKSHAPAAAGAKSYSTDEIEAIRAKLFKALPPQEVMVEQIKKKLYSEEKVLLRRLKQLQKHSHTSAWQMTIVVQQLRRVEQFFFMLAHATYELVKHLWLKIVHGV